MSNETTEAGKPAATAEPLALRLNDLLGPLPEARKPDENGAGWFTAGQMRTYAAEQVAAERERCKACVQYSQVRNGYHNDHGQRIGHYNVRMFQWIDGGHDPRA